MKFHTTEMFDLLATDNDPPHTTYIVIWGMRKAFPLQAPQTMRTGHCCDGDSTTMMSTLSLY